VERLAGQKLLRDLTLERDVVGSVPRHGLSSFESPGPVNSAHRTCPVRGAHSN
jgi:hypothetical protein